MKYSPFFALLTALPHSIAAATDIQTGQTQAHVSSSTDYTIEEGGVLTFLQMQNTDFNQIFTFTAASTTIPAKVGENVAVIGWSNSENAISRTVSFIGATFAGTGNARIAVKSTRATTVDMQDISGQNFSGSVAVTNVWDGAVTVKYRGTGLSSGLYLFGTTAATYNTPTNAVQYGTSRNSAYTLNITGNASLAGISGSTIYTGKEFITATGTGSMLTLTGSDTYTYGGTMGSASQYLNLSLTGGGTQSLTGSTYLGDILLGGGSSLVLAQNATINGNITIDLTGLAEGTYNFITGKDVTLSESNLTGLGSHMKATIKGGTVTLQMVPEPSIASLGLIGLAGLVLYRRRRK